MERTYPALRFFPLFSLQIKDAEQEVNRARNLIVHEQEIKARPPREWIQTQKEKEEVTKERSEAFKVSKFVRLPEVYLAHLPIRSADGRHGAAE